MLGNVLLLRRDENIFNNAISDEYLEHHDTELFGRNFVAFETFQRHDHTLREKGGKGGSGVRVCLCVCKS